MNRRSLLFLILLAYMAVDDQFSSILKALCDNKSCAVRWTLTREAMLSMRAAAPVLDQRMRIYIASLGCAGQRRGKRGGRYRQRRHEWRPRDQNNISCCYNIPVLIGRRDSSDREDVGRGCPQSKDRVHSRRDKRREVFLRRIPIHRTMTDNNGNTAQSESRPSVDYRPSLYVINAASLSKPYAVQQLTVDLSSCNVDIAAVTETHLKAKHTDSSVAIPGYILLRRDRLRRKGGGVALYVRATLQASPWSFSADNRIYEILWVKAGSLFVGVLYHPPKPSYTIDSLLDYLESTVNEIERDFPAADVVLSGDFNQLPQDSVVRRTGLTQIVHQPTRGGNVLDQIYESYPIYNTVRVVRSVIKSDHKAVVAYSFPNQCVPTKTTTVRTFRKYSPAQNASFLQYISSLDVESDEIQAPKDTQKEFDEFYSRALFMLNQFYPEHTITVTSRDQEFVTPAIKASLRRKNRLMRAGRVEEASALAARIGKKINNSCAKRLSKIDGRVDSKGMWAAVREITGRGQQANKVDGITATSLNQYFAAISTDCGYQAPARKQTTSLPSNHQVSEWRVFTLLDTMRPTATGLDQLPSWFLKLGAPYFYKPLVRLFNMSLDTSTVPSQWKAAYIRPVPKVSPPQSNTDFRPISVTPVLTRIMERIIVREYLYPAFISPPPLLNFTDQFAFRPTGSTTATLITILHSVTSLLADNPYVVVIAVDFSKAFDSVRHATLLEKVAQLSIPDNVYNWLVDFFLDRSHCVRYNEDMSALLSITASIIQGSAIGPAAYVVNAADLTSVTPGNKLYKYADDTYIIVPAVNIQSRETELAHIDKWAAANNLKLNRSKSREIIFTESRRRRAVCLPPELADIQRVTSLKILGVTVTNHLAVSEHVRDVTCKCMQSMHALRILRCHGLSTESLQMIYKAVVVAKLTYASPAWWGFTTTDDRNRIDGVLKRGVRAGLYLGPTVSQLIEDVDDRLFSSTLYNEQHVLNLLLPDRHNTKYNLRSRRHDCTLSAITDRRNFIHRMIFKDMY